jgi:release factor glutamine methyltransferase
MKYIDYRLDSGSRPRCGLGRNDKTYSTYCRRITLGQATPICSRGDTVLSCLRAAQAALSTISQTPALDAELLLAYVLGRERSYLHAHPEALLSEPQNQRYGIILERRARGEPVAYILGVKEFWSLPLRVTPDVLIPRPETELLVELALARIPQHEPLRIADLGTGSGAIAFAIATERPECRVIATDVSQAALAVAADSARRLGLTNIRFLNGDWFSPLRGRFHLIVSNPPYVDADDPDLEDALLQFEPPEALISAAGGLADLQIIAERAGAFLHPDGWLIVEHGHDQGARVRDLFERHGLQEVETHRDLAGNERTTLGRRGRT